jgi:hypothetical protein
MLGNEVEEQQEQLARHGLRAAGGDVWLITGLDEHVTSRI